MPLFFPIPRPRNLFIYSLFTLQKSLKSYPKHFKCLKIETKSFGYGDFQILPKYLLKTLQRRAKSLKVLDLEQHEQFFNLKVPQALTLIKSCNHLISLTLLGDIYRYFSHKSYLKWLTQSKKLTHLTFGDFKSSYLDDVYRSQNASLLEAVQTKYEKILKRTKLLSLDLKSSEAIGAHSSFPSTLKQLSTSRKCFLTKYLLNLSHLPYLSILYVNLLLFFDNLLKILHSLPNPHKITHFIGYAGDCFDPNDQYALKIQRVLAQSQSLRSLNLGIISFLSISTLLRSLKTPSNLRELTLYIPIKKQKELIELAELIESLKNLSLLAIMNADAIQCAAIKGHQIFFNKISGLTQLKSLEIKLCRDHLVKPELSHGCLGMFAGCVERLHGLQEINFMPSEYIIETELDFLVDALKKKGSSLKRLKIKFVPAKKKMDYLAKLNKALKAMENLEELSLENLWVESQSLIQFGEIISELKWIRSVKLEGSDPGLEKTDFVRTIKKILMTYGLEELKWFEWDRIQETKNFGEGDSIDIKEIIWKNPRLYNVCVDFSGEKKRGLGFKNVKNFLP